MYRIPFWSSQTESQIGSLLLCWVVWFKVCRWKGAWCWSCTVILRRWTWSFPCSPGGRKKLVAINKEPIKSLCPPLSESWDLEGTKETVSRVAWVEPKEPHGDWSGGSWFSSIGQEELDMDLERRSLNLIQKKNWKHGQSWGKGQMSWQLGFLSSWMEVPWNSKLQ